MAFAVRRGKYWYGVWYEGTGSARRQKWKSLKVTGPKTPIGKLHELEQEIEAKKGGYNKEITWDTFSKLYLEWAEANKVKQSLERDRITIRHFNDLVPVYLLNTILPYHLERYKIERRKAGIQESTVNRELNTLRGMTKKAVEWGNLIKDPWLSVKKFTPTRARPETFCGKEEDLLKACQSPYERAVLHLGLYQGLRRGEMANLMWEDLDFKNGSMKIASGMGRRTKSKRERWLPIHPKTEKALKALPSRGAYVLGVKGKKADEDILTRQFAAILKRAGIQGTLHKTRHTLGTNLAQAGVDPKTIMEILGHSRITTTEIYLQSSESMKRQAILGLD